MPERIRLTRIASVVEKLDIIASEIEQENPQVALAIDLISDKLSKTAHLVDRKVQIKDDEESLAIAKKILDKYPKNQAKIVEDGTKIEGLDKPLKGTHILTYYVHPTLYPLDKKWPKPEMGPESLDPMWDELDKSGIVIKGL